MITPTTILVLSSLMIIAAMALVIVLLARTTRKVVDQNTEMAERILERGSLLKSHPEYTIEGICKDAGFSSRRTFQSIFKSRLGVSPSEYRGAVLNQAKLSQSN